MCAERKLGIHKKHEKYARNHQYTQRDEPESSIQGKRMAGIDNVCRKNAWNHKYICKENIRHREKLRGVNKILKYVNEILKYVKSILKYVNNVLKYTNNVLKDVNNVLKEANNIWSKLIIF